MDEMLFNNGVGRFYLCLFRGIDIIFFCVILVW